MAEMKLNNAQREAVEYSDGPLLIVAGAGTGKTSVVTQKIAHLIAEKRAKPQDIVALTFTDKAAQEMEERVDVSVDIGYSDMQISTFHAFCQGLLEQYGLDIGIPHRFRLMTETDAWLLVRKHLYSFDLDYYRPLGNPTQHIHALLQHFSTCKDELISPADYLHYATSDAARSDDVPEDEQVRRVELATAYQQYNQLLLDNAALDFGDLVYYAVKLLRERPHIRVQLQEQISFLLVDEFQDVNHAQYELIELLATSVDGSKTPQLTVVGDDDQSIYAFRGASVSNILRFHETYPDAKHVVLTQNYRSGQEILDAAYMLIQENNPNRLEEKLRIDKKLMASGAVKNASLSHLHYHTLDDEIVGVVESIIKNKQNDSVLSWDDVAILVRANNHAEAFMDALEKRGVPYEFLSSAGLYRQPIVIDAINVFKAVVNKYDAGAVYRLLCLPSFGLDGHDLQQFTAMAKKKSTPYFEGLSRAAVWGLSKHGVQVCERLQVLLTRSIRQARDEHPTTILQRFFDESGTLQHLAEQEAIGDVDGLRAIEHLSQFFEYVHAYEAVTPGADIQTFMDHFSQVLESGEDGTIYQPADTPDSVNIMTVHGSKGLEFRHVYIVNCVEQRFPSTRRGGGIELPPDLVHETMPSGDYHYQEERRLFYVAMTRAKERLYFASADDYGGKRKKKLSRFLASLGYSSNGKTPRPTRAVRAETQTAVAGMPHYTLPKTFSFSQIKAFQMCPYQYKMRYVLGLPQPGSHYLSFGNTMHLTLQRFYERIQEMNAQTQPSLFSAPAPRKTDDVHVPSRDALLQIYEKTWIPDWYKSTRQRNDYFKKGKQILTTLYNNNDGRWCIPVALESGFRIRIGQYTITGKIDRVDQLADGALEIIDYKTGKSKEKLSGDDKQQLLLYQKAAEMLPRYRNIGPVERLTFYFLNDDLKTSFKGDEKDLASFEQKIVASLDDMHALDFRDVTRENGCGRCDVCRSFV